MYLITKWFGTFLCTKQGIQKYILFPKKKEEIIKRLEKIQNNHIFKEEKKLAENKKVRVGEKRLEPIGEYIFDDPFFKEINIKAVDYGYPEELLYNISSELTKRTIEQKLQSEDLQIIQMVNALDDLIQTANLLSERLTCWALIPTPKEKIEPFTKTYETITKEMKRLEEQIDKDMKTIAPNTTQLVGAHIGARLIALAGGMEKLAMMPASTIQILGAEKALFRFKKEGGKPPKHGIIFQHQSINKAPRNKRGRIARMVASKITIAIKADHFTKRNIAHELNEELEQKIQEIKNK